MLAFAGVLVLLKTAEKRLVRFDFARKLRFAIFVQHRANLLAHPPRAFVGNAKLPLQLLCGDTASSTGHEVHRAEPELQRSGGVLKDGSAHWVFVMAAILAGLRRTLAVAMMIGNGLTLRAENTIRIEPFNQFFEASGVIGIVSLEIH